MSYLEFIGFFGAFLTGIVIGHFGGGGSILAVPIFVYLFKLNPVIATSYSMFVVGSSAAIGTLINLKKKLIEYKTALIFTLPALVSVFLTRRFVIPNIPDVLLSFESFDMTKEMGLMLFFSSIIMLSSVLMMKKSKTETTTDLTSKKSYGLLIFIGLGIGVLTGLVGAGGGFIIVPALVLFARLTIKQAVATSLIIITFNSLIGFSSDLSILKIEWDFLMLFTALSILGIFVGTYISNYVRESTLKINFA
ncbi:sulfite exporter TauE/SafE family protein, partial [Flavobacteriaceae bacterium]|nr:sulfite exporter TauE/SafE family protein [Flavobacteriaceae bacterium]